MNTFVILLFLLVAFQLKHYLVDFVIQINDPNGMRKFDATGWVMPLLKHASQHGLMSAIIAASFYLALSTTEAVTLGFTHLIIIIGVFLFDTSIHFTMDRIKASPYMLGRYGPNDKGYWYALGADQAVHHLTHYAIIGFLLLY